MAFVDRRLFSTLKTVLGTFLLVGLLLVLYDKGEALATTPQIAVGNLHSVALKQDGTVWTWGRNTEGQLGNGTTIDNSFPAQVSNLNEVVSIACGDYHTLALKEDGTIWAWGKNVNGELGDGTTTSRNHPIQVQGISNATAIASQGYYSVALKADGTVWTWGRNLNGELGNGTTTDSSVPVLVSGLSGVVAISSGFIHTMALKADGTVWTWGHNGYGQLGDGTIINSSIPVQVQGLGPVSVIAGGGYHSIAIKTDGTVMTWGAGWRGQLGNGTLPLRSTVPVQVTGLTTAMAIAGGGNNTIAIKSDGTVWSWGTGINGDGTSNLNSLPVQVIGLQDVIAAALNGYSIVLKEDGSLWGWGGNSYGGLGNGIGNVYLIPIQVNINLMDTTSPDTHITAQPINPTNLPSASFNFTSTETGSSFQCSLDGATFASCTSPVNYIGLAAGNHSFSVKATDSAANNDDTPAIYAWTIDTAAPITTASPVGGSYNAALSITLSCNDGMGAGCATTYYCLGSDCTPSIPYSVAIPITASQVLRVYSNDNASNNETVQAVTYTITYPPNISGTPTTSVTAGIAYGFTPTATNATSFSITNKPVWASFDTTTGALTGTPSNANVGTYSNIVISSTNSTGTVSLPGFSITVAPTSIFQFTEIGPNSFGYTAYFTPNYAFDKTIFLAAAYGKVYKSTDAGDSFLPANSGINVQYVRTLAISPNYSSDNTLFGTSGWQGILRSTNGGDSWQRVFIPAQDDRYNTFDDPRSIVFSSNYDSDHTVFAGGGNLGTGCVYKSIDGGNSWQKTGLINTYIFSLAASPQFHIDGTLFAEAWDRLYKTTDRGTTWTTAGNFPGNTYKKIAISPNYFSDQTIFVGLTENGGGLYKSTDGGSTWNQVNLTITNPIVTSISVSPNFALDGTMYILSGDRLYRSSDFGNSWIFIESFPALGLTGIAISPNFGMDGTVFLSSTEGIYKYAAIPTTTASPVPAAYRSAQSVTLTANKDATIYYTNDGTFPTAQSQVYIAPIDVSSTTTLKFFARDTAGNSEIVKNASYIIDVVSPTTIVSPASGTYNTNQNITLTCNDEVDGSGCDSIYYCLGNGCDPVISYSAAIPVTNSQILRFYSRDNVNNSETVQQATYTIIYPPTISGTPPTSATVGSAYSFTPTAANATSFSISGSVPPGLSFKTTTGSLSGTPTTAGTYSNIVISATNSTGTASLPGFTITVLPPPAISIESGPLPYSNQASGSITFSANRANATFECGLDGDPFVACTSPFTYAALQKGNHTLSVKATALGEVFTPVSYNWTINTTLATSSSSLLPHTGQTKCYDTAGAEIGCDGTGQDGDVEAGTAWPIPRFADGGDGTVIDKVSGLVWAKNANIMATRDPGFDADGAPGDGNVSWQHALDYVKKLNQETYLGYSDWRLPNFNEILSLTNLSESNVQGWLTQQGFIDVGNGYYWSSTYLPGTGGAGSVHMWNGFITYGYTTEFDDFRAAWPVRTSGSKESAISLPRTGQMKCYDSTGPEIACAGTGQDGELQAGVAWPNPRFTDNGNQTMTDNLTGLIWIKNPNASGPDVCAQSSAPNNWEGALDHMRCLNQNNYLGATDWRLPNFKELLSLINWKESFQLSWLSEQGFSIGQNFHFWSSTTHAGETSLGLGISMFDGLQGNYWKSASLSIWPVRGGIVASNGVCGSSDGGTFTASPTANLCSAGTAATVTGTGPWSWTCAGSNGGTTANCAAAIQTYTITFSTSGNGSVSGATSQTVNYGESSSIVTATPATGYHFVNWTGDNGFVATTSNPLTITNVTLSHTITANFAPNPVNGVCGSANGGTFLTTPSGNICSVGTASGVTGAGPWNWTCAGLYGGTTASCSANIQSFTVTFASGGNGTLSGAINQSVNYGGTTSAVTANPVSGYHFVSWTEGATVVSTNATIAPATITSNHTYMANFAPDAVSGLCGSSNGGTFTSAPTSNLCNAGTPSGLIGSGPWSWTCTGLYGGTTASCSANLSSNPGGSITLRNGWNTVAVPFNTNGALASSLFSGRISSIYEWIPAGTTLEASTTQVGNYAKVSSFAPGKGYFVKTYDGNTQLAYSGTSSNTVTLTLKPGWTMIASPSLPTRTGIGTDWVIDMGTAQEKTLANAITLSIIGGGIYSWNGVTYDSWSILGENPQVEPWKGYWIINLQPTDHTLTIQ